MIDDHTDLMQMSVDKLHREYTMRLRQLESWIEYKETITGDEALQVAQREINWFQDRLKRIKQMLEYRQQ
jgi:hypothetical protein